MKNVLNFFRNNLDPEDHFGFISLDDPKQASKDEIRLERCESNKNLKVKVMKNIAKREIDYVFNREGSNSAKMIRLERALEKAYDWQNNLVQNFQTTVNNKIYIGPHKWIVCILGDDVYSVNQFRLNNQARLAGQKNMSISIMTMTAEAKDKKHRSKDYHELTELSRKGLFVSVVEK